MRSAASTPLAPSEAPRVFGSPTLHTEAELLALGMNLDGTLWSVEEPGLLRQWDIASRRQQGQRTLDELATVWAFNWAGRLVASASDEVSVHEVASGEQMSGWKAPSWVTALAFRPGTPVLATGHDDGLVQVWDWADRKLLWQAVAHERAAVSALAFSRDGTRLASAGEDKFIRLWNATDGTGSGALEGHTDRIPALSWHPDGKRLFSAGWDTTVRVWNLATLQPIILLNAHSRQVHAAVLSADGQLLASADADSAIHVWDTDTYEERAILRASTAEVTCLCFTPDDDRGNIRPPLLAYGGADGVIYLWDSRQGEVTGSDATLSRTCLAVGSAGKVLYSLGADTSLRAWRVDCGEPSISLEDSPVLRAFALSPDSQWIAASRREDSRNIEDKSTLGLYQVATGHRVAICAGQKAPVTTMAFSPSSSLLASAGMRGSDVWLWTVPGGSPALLLNEALDGCAVEALAWHPEGQLLAVAGVDWMATGGGDGEVVVWDVWKRQVTNRVKGGATALAYHPGGEALAIAGLDRVLRLVAVDGSERRLAGHQDSIFCVAFSPDGTRLASGGEDRTIRLWDFASGELLGAWELENDIRAVAFGPCGKYLYTGNGNTSCYQFEIEALIG